MDQLDPVSASDSEHPNSQTKEGTPAQPLLHCLHSDSPAVSVFVEVPSRKRKRSSRPPSPKPGPRRPSQPPADEIFSRASQPSKRWRIDCVLITTLPPMPRKKIVPPEQSGDEEDLSRTKAKIHGRRKQQGKQREVAPTLRTSVLSDSRSLVGKSTRSRSHSVSSLRPLLFEPVSIGPI